MIVISQSSELSFELIAALPQQLCPLVQGREFCNVRSFDQDRCRAIGVDAPVPVVAQAPATRRRRRRTRVTNTAVRREVRADAGGQLHVLSVEVEAQGIDRCNRNGERNPGCRQFSQMLDQIETIRPWVGEIGWQQ